MKIETSSDWWRTSWTIWIKSHSISVCVPHSPPSPSYYEGWNPLSLLPSICTVQWTCTTTVQHIATQYLAGNSHSTYEISLTRKEAWAKNADIVLCPCSPCSGCRIRDNVLFKHSWIMAGVLESIYNLYAVCTLQRVIRCTDETHIVWPPPPHTHNVLSYNEFLTKSG
jgi:hypothetical protein